MEILLGLVFCTVVVIVGIVRFFSNREKKQKHANSLRISSENLDLSQLDEFLENLEGGGRTRKNALPHTVEERKAGYGGKI